MMEILINELSLKGQFDNEDKFLDNLENILRILKLIEIFDFVLLKNSMLFDVNITSSYKMVNLLALKTDRIRKLKSFIAKLSNNPPYWDDNKKHKCSDTYNYKGKNVCNTSLAESCERDKIILSFNHRDFSEDICILLKNTENLNIFNIIDMNKFLEYLLLNKKINCFQYCQNKFKNSKLNFEEINHGFGFDSLKNSQQEKEFIQAFDLFDRTDWSNILASDGLEYKQYTPSKSKNWFKGTKFEHINIYKFRVTQKYRCFGYRTGDMFNILRFEIDHEISDNG
ncbi:hypothetical protein [Aliarcobacter butzleri]|uniref:hypothetical protein n=1 Tax=Aliarcobacter butzleri TaxID=28197 RepID=UPI001EDB82FA|nr:hypothetical protein [Aliarcobacter butzleri]MCG3654992.1 hypothetical protein [Aliarcobacter butzleri]